MAKKNTVKPNTNKGESKIEKLKNFLANERVRFVAGLVISIMTLYVGLALLSFFFTGAADQSKIENVPLADLVVNRGSVENWTGVRGAYLSDLLMNRWFGVSSFLILFFLGSVGAKLMNLKHVSLLKRFLFCASMLIWGSLFFAFVFIRGYEDSFIYLGGQHGYYISVMMMNNIGVPGTFLLLLGMLLIIAVFTSKRTIPFLQQVLRFQWLKMPHLKKAAPAMASVDGSDYVEDENPLPTDAKKQTETPVFDTEAEMQKQETEPIAEKESFSVTVATDEDYYPVVEPEAPAENKTKTTSTNDEVVEELSFTVEVPGDDDLYDASVQGDYDPKLDLSSFKNPSIDLLKKYDQTDHQVDMEEQMANQKRIKQTLESFGISIASIKATVGPTITLYEVVPDTGVRISKIKNLEDDIALNLSDRKSTRLNYRHEIPSRMPSSA